jgi:hypothetical protein
MGRMKLIVTIGDPALLEKVRQLPKNVRGKAVEKALTIFFASPEGKGLADLFKAPKEAKVSPNIVEKGVLGDFSD